MKCRIVRGKVAKAMATAAKTRSATLHRTSAAFTCALTVKLSGRTQAPDQSRGRTLSSRARGAYRQTAHGPLQRLLDVPTY